MQMNHKTSSSSKSYSSCSSLSSTKPMFEGSVLYTARMIRRTVYSATAGPAVRRSAYCSFELRSSASVSEISQGKRDALLFSFSLNEVNNVSVTAWCFGDA